MGQSFEAEYGIIPGKHHIPFGNEVVSYHYQPYQTKECQGLVIMTAGMGDGVDEYDPGIESIARHGFSTIKVAGPHGAGGPRWPDRAIEAIPQRAVDAVWQVKDHIFPDEDVKPYIFGPSMGGRIALKAAQERPHAVSGVVVANPAFCPPGSSFVDRTVRYIGSGIDSYRKGDASFRKGSWKTLNRLLSSPIASLRLGVSSLEQDLPSVVFELAEHNVSTAFVLGEDDPVFNPDETKNCFLDYFYTKYAEKRKTGVVFSRSFAQMVPAIVQEKGGHYLEDYAEVGMKALHKMGGIERRRGRKSKETVLFDASSEV